MKELNLEETKIVSGGHRASVRQFTCIKWKRPSTRKRCWTRQATSSASTRNPWWMGQRRHKRLSFDQKKYQALLIYE